MTVRFARLSIHNSIRAGAKAEDLFDLLLARAIEASSELFKEAQYFGIGIAFHSEVRLDAWQKTGPALMLAIDLASD